MAQHISNESLDVVEEKINSIRLVIPECFTEGALDTEKLEKILGKNLERNDDKYTFNWAGRNDTFKIIQTTSKGTLIPKESESIDFTETKNIFIEGDNLEVLKLLQKSYFDKIGFIYIDPPYNTGKDFIYKDDFHNSIRAYLEQTGQTTEGVKLTTNLETSGRFHSSWISMMYPRLFIARNLLSEDRVIFVSIGQKELHNLIMILNDIFGEENKIGIISRAMKSGGNKGEYFSPNIDYILVYAKDISLADSFRLSLDEEYIKKIYNKIEVKGPRKGERYREMGLYQGYLEKRKNQRYWIKCPDGSLAIPPGNTLPSEMQEGSKAIPEYGDGVWRWIYPTYLIEKDDIEFKKTETSSLINEHRKQSNWNIYTKIWAKDRIKEGRVPTDLITKFENRHSSAELKELDIPFDFAKPSKLISYLISFFEKDDLIVLDFFAGSGTTAQSVLELNNQDGGNRRFILVQFPEPTPDESEAHKRGYKNIAEIAKERIRRVSKRIQQNKKIVKQKKLVDDLDQLNSDVGFKVFQLARSNFKVWDDLETRSETDLKEQMKLFETSLLIDSNDENVIYECAIRQGFDLNINIKKMDIKSNIVYRVGENGSSFYITLDKVVKNGTIEKLRLSEENIFFCIDVALTDSMKTNLSKQCILKTF